MPLFVPKPAPLAGTPTVKVHPVCGLAHGVFGHAEVGSEVVQCDVADRQRHPVAVVGELSAFQAVTRSGQQHLTCGETGMVLTQRFCQGK